MKQPKDRESLTLHKERCLLAAAIIPGRYASGEDTLDELAELITTAGGEVIGQITQKLDQPHHRTYLGKGKFEELAELARELSADTIVVDDALTPTQLQSIEDACRCKVIDRNEVILDIFAAHARSHQAKLQVELAQVQYQLPRLARKWTHLERLGGGIGTRGPGEAQIETDRRILHNRIARLKSELAVIEARKERQVKNRDTFQIALVGYTNAGKSSLMNRLTSASTLVEDKLFATLDTLTRKLKLPNRVEVLISDTVGFLRRLPHHLVASFHATLEEARGANLLMIVLDGADPISDTLLHSVVATLVEMELQDKPRLLVINKIDIADISNLNMLLERYPEAIPVSAHTGQGIDALLQELQQQATTSWLRVKINLPVSDGRRLSALSACSQILNTRYADDTAILTVKITDVNLNRIKSMPGQMEVEILDNLTTSESTSQPDSEEKPVNYELPDTPELNPAPPAPVMAESEENTSLQDKYTVFSNE